MVSRIRFLCCLIPAIFFAMPAGALEVEGNQITYKNRPITLKGVNVGDPLLARPGRPYSDYAHIAGEWQANTVRISIHPGTWKKYGYETVIRVLQREITAANQAGLFVILDWHAIGTPGGYTQAAPEMLMADLYDADMKLAEEFWRLAAQHFGKNSDVVFELWNEPVAKYPHQRLLHWEELKPQWERLTQVIRTVGANNLILASGGLWAYDMREISGDLLADANTAYAWHVYHGREETTPERWDEFLGNLPQLKPVVVTEWGISPEATDQNDELWFANQLQQKMQQTGLHPIAWIWHPHWTPSLIEHDWKTPTPYGSVVKQQLHSFQTSHRPQAATVKKKLNLLDLLF